MDMILMMVVIFAVFYFLFIRPQSKRMKEHQALINSIEPGTRVLLTSGIFATVLHVGERQMIVELDEDVEVTIVKGHVSKIVSPEDEEFVYAQDAAEQAAETPTPTSEELREMFEAPSAENSDDPSDDDKKNR